MSINFQSPSLKRAVVASALLTTAASPLLAQSATQTAADVPGVVIESATVDKPRVATPRKASASPQAETDQPVKSKAPSKAATAPAPATGLGPVPGGAAGVPTTASATGADDAVPVGIPAEQVGSSVSVVTAADIKARQITYAADALRSLPGVSVTRSGTPGSITEVRIRGAENRHTLILIDGIDASEAGNGAFDLSNLAADDIERIEVLRGGQSGVGGSKAIGGVISITTKGGKGPLTVAASAEGGSYGSRSIGGRISGGSDQFWLSASASQKKYDGFNIAPQGIERDPGKLTTVALKGGARIVEGLTLDFSVRHSQKEFDYDDFGLNPGATYFTAVDGTPFNRTDIWLGGAKLTWDTFGGALTHVVTAQANRSDSRDDDRTFPGQSKNLSETQKYGYAATLRLGSPDLVRHAITASIQKEEEDFTPIAFFADGILRHRERVATIGEYRGEIANLIYPTLSVRHDDNDSFSDYTTWHAAVSMPLRSLGMRPHASVGTAVTLPTMFSQFGYVLADFRPNPNLKPEQSSGWDAGVEFTVLAGRAAIDVTYFKADLTDKIESQFDFATFTSSPVNRFGVSHREGVEIAGRWNVTPTLTLGGAYTYLDATDPKGVVEIRRPTDSARIDANLLFDGGRGNLNVAAVYNGETKDRAFDANFDTALLTLKDYWLVNVAASYAVAPGVEAFGRIENLLDQHYQEAYGYQTAGIAAFAGMRFKLEAPASKP